MRDPLVRLYDDDGYAAFDKPPGIPVVPAASGDRRTLTALVNRDWPWPGGRLIPCHRLDKDTTGVVLFAKGKQREAAMRRMFAARRVHKTYLAIVKGRLKHLAGRIDTPVMSRHERAHGRRGRGESALTEYRLIRQARAFALLEVVPVTGRTHQIRIHLKGIGHPVLGERLYAFGRDFNVNFRRLALHAARLSWPHPDTGKTVTVESPLPGDMREFLGRYGIKL